MDVLNLSPSFIFTRLHARILQENGGFTVSIRMLNHLKHEDSAWGQQTAASIEMASGMIAGVAEQFSIPQNCISINIVMDNFKDGTLH